MPSTDADLAAIRALLMPGFEGTSLPEWLADRLRAGLGAVCIFGMNITSMSQLRDLVAQLRAANPRVLIAIDEEGGDVTRLFYEQGSPVAGNAVLGRIDDLAHTEHVARRIGQSLATLGVNLDFAPDADANSNPDNPVIGTRSFGARADLVARHVGAWTRGLQSSGVAACAKHFPGHGDTAQDSHLALPVVDRSLAELRERELIPFAAAIRAGTRCIMTSHIMVPQLDPDAPATFSQRILTDLLRDELGFYGVIVSDALDMVGASGEIGIPEAAVRAVAAGCDLLCIGTRNTAEQMDEIESALLGALADGRLAEDRVVNAQHRVLALADSLLPVAHEPAESVAAIDTSAIAELRDDDLRRTMAAFDVNDAARAFAAERHGPYSLVRIDAGTNAAVGAAPWGPQPAASSVWQSVTELAPAGDSAGSGDSDDPAGGASTGMADLDALDPDRALVVVGRDIHRHAFARRVVDDLRARRDDLVVVDMGWPSDDRAYADIATFGGSRLVTAALDEFLTGATTVHESMR